MKILAWSCLPKRCRQVISNSRDRLLAKVHEELKQEMSINHLLKQLRVLEALVKEKFTLTQSEWKDLY